MLSKSRCIGFVSQLEVMGTHTSVHLVKMAIFMKYNMNSYVAFVQLKLISSLGMYREVPEITAHGGLGFLKSISFV